MEFLIHVAVTAGLLLLVARVVKGFKITDGKVALWSALVLGLANGFVRPILVFFTLPFTILTLGLFLIVINAVMLKLAAALVKGFDIKGFGPALLGSVVLSLLNLAVSMVFGI
jgi:putative membrane protein